MGLIARLGRIWRDGRKKLDTTADDGRVEHKSRLSPGITINRQISFIFYSFIKSQQEQEVRVYLPSSNLGVGLMKILNYKRSKKMKVKKTKSVKRSGEECKGCLVQQSDNTEGHKNEQCQYWCGKYN